MYVEKSPVLAILRQFQIFLLIQFNGSGLSVFVSRFLFLPLKFDLKSAQHA